VDNTIADLCQVLVAHLGWVVGPLVRRRATVQYLPLQIEELLGVELNLKGFLDGVIVLVYHGVLKHRVLVLDLIVDLLVEVAHCIVWVLVAKISRVGGPFFFKKDVRQAWLVTVLPSS